MALPPNYQQKRVMDSMLRDYKLGQHFGSDSKKQGLMDLMVKHNITKDLKTMKDYEKKAFLHDVKSMRSDQLTIQGKRAFEETYGPQKPNANKEIPGKKNSYDEIMEKRKAEQQKISQVNSQPRKMSVLNMLGFRSNDNVGAARDLVKRADNNWQEGKADNHDEIRERINRIQG